MGMAGRILLCKTEDSIDGHLAVLFLIFPG